MPDSSPQPHVIDWRLDASEAVQRHTSTAPEEEAALAAVRRKPGLVEQFAATVRSLPCASNVVTDYSDARYYLDRAIATGSASAALTVQSESLPGLRQCLTATNLAELAGGTHLIPPGTVVQVFALYTRPGVKVYVFNQTPPDGAVVKITGAAAGGGKYTGRILTGASSALAPGTLAMPEGLTVPAADNALVCNEEEDGQSGHRLSLPCFAVGQLAGTSNGLTVVMIRGALGAVASPKGLGDGTGGAVAADATAFSKSTDALPLDVWVQTRTVWDSSTGTLYGYLRKFSFDARGVLYAVSGENRITVDVAQACQ